MNVATAQYLKLEAMCRPSVEIPHERTEAEEDQMAMEQMVLELQGPDALTRYQSRWAVLGSRRSL